MLLTFGHKKNGARFAAVLETLSVPVMIADEGQNIVFVNEALKQFLTENEPAIKESLPKFSVKSLVGSNIDVFHKEPSHQRHMIEKMEGLFETTIEVGGVKFDLAAQPIVSGARRIGIVVEWRDAADRIARRDYKAQVDAVGRSQAVCAFEPDGTLLSANAAFCSATGYALEEIVGQHHSIFMPGDRGSDPTYHEFWDSLRKGKGEVSEYERVRKDGSILWIQATYSPLLDDHGDVYQVVEFAFDITDEVEKRSKLRKTQVEISNDLQEITTAVSSVNHQAATVATTSDQASQNVQTIASAIEELVASIREINEKVADASNISRQAEDEAGRTTETVAGLSDAAAEIENVVKLISDIAEQTNLLALNATIEAARAGEAGKGFAVVASEVKELATQTGKATDEIGQSIQRVQANTEQAVEAIKSISDTIIKISELTAIISSAVEEQSATTSEMSSSMQIAAEGVRQISDGVGEIARAASTVDTSVQKVGEAAARLG